MKDMKIIDLSENEKLSDFENTKLILITNITESNIKNAITIAESAQSSQAVTVGILSGNINPLNKNIKRFLDVADAAIISRGNDEAEIISEISGIITKSGFINIGIEGMTEFLNDAGMVYYGIGLAKNSRTAAKKAAEMCRDITNAKSFIINITAGTEVELKAALGELAEASRFLVTKSAPDAQVIWGYMTDETMGGNVRVTIFAAMNDK